MANKIVVNGQTIVVEGSASVSTVSGVTTVSVEGTEAKRAPEPFTGNVVAGERKMLSGMGAKAVCFAVDGVLKVDGMNANIAVGHLSGEMQVEGMNAEVRVLAMHEGATLTVEGMNAEVRIDSAFVSGVSVTVSGMNSELEAPKTIASMCEVSGMNSQEKFH